MQLVSREIFKKLVSKPDLVEADKTFDYTEFVKNSQKILVKNGIEGVPKSYQQIKKSLQPFCPPVAFCGEGSSRAAYALDGGKCLKLAMTKAGIMQNKQEIKICKENSHYSCFPAFYEYDNVTYESLLTDCCMEAKDEDFRRIYGITCNALYYVLRNFIEKEKRPEDAAKTVILDYYDTGSGRGFDDMMQDLVRNIGRGQQPKFKVLYDLILFYFENDWAFDEMLLDDFDRPDNWGLHKVGNEIVPVIIDAGLSSEIYDVFYRWH